MDDNTDISGFFSDIEFGEPEQPQKEDTAQQVYDMVRPLLINLSEGSGDTIKWPEKTRKKQIRQVMTKIEKMLQAQN